MAEQSLEAARVVPESATLVAEIAELEHISLLRPALAYLNLFDGLKKAAPLDQKAARLKALNAEIKSGVVRASEGEKDTHWIDWLGGLTLIQYRDVKRPISSHSYLFELVYSQRMARADLTPAALAQQVAPPPKFNANAAYVRQLRDLGQNELADAYMKQYGEQ